MSDSQTPNTRAIFNQAAQRYQDKYMDVSLYESGLQAFCEQIKTPKARILDIACGPGNISQYLLSQRADFQLLGIDLAEEMLGLAERNNPSACSRCAERFISARWRMIIPNLTGKARVMAVPNAYTPTIIKRII